MKTMNAYLVMVKQSDTQSVEIDLVRADSKKRAIDKIVSEYREAGELDNYKVLQSRASQNCLTFQHEKFHDRQLTFMICGNDSLQAWLDRTEDNDYSCLEQ